MKNLLIAATLVFSIFILASLSLVVSAQAGPTAKILIFPQPLRVGNIIYPYGDEATGPYGPNPGEIVNYRFYCEGLAGNELTLSSGPNYYEQSIPASTYNPCCSGGTCEEGELLTISLEVTDQAGNTDIDSTTVTIWPAPHNLRDFMYNKLVAVPRTEMLMELMTGSDILNNYKGKKMFLYDGIGGEDARVGATFDYTEDLIYPWAEYAVAQSPFNPNLIAVITLDDMAVGGYMDGRAIFSADYPWYVTATIVVNGINEKVEERWLWASGSDVHGGIYILPSTIRSIRTCAFAKPDDTSLPFLAATMPLTEAPQPTPDPNPTPCPDAPIEHIFSHKFRDEVKSNGYINHYW